MGCNCKKRREEFQNKINQQKPTLTQVEKPITQSVKPVQPIQLTQPAQQVSLSPSALRFLARQERIKQRQWRELKRQRLAARRLLMEQQIKKDIQNNSTNPTNTTNPEKPV